MSRDVDQERRGQDQAPPPPVGARPGPAAGEGHPVEADVSPLVVKPVEVEGPGAHPAADGSGVDRGALILGGLRGAAAWAWRFLLVSAALVVIVWAIGALWVGVLPIILALIVSSVLWPPVRWLRSHRVPAALASILVVLGSLTLFVAIIAAISPSVAGQAREVAGTATEGVDVVIEWLAGPPLNLSNEQLNEYVDQVTAWVQDRASDVASGALVALTTVGSILITLSLTLVLTFFFLKDGPRFLPFVRRSTGRTAGMYLTEALSRIWITLGGFLRAQAMVALVDAVFIGLGMWAFGVPLAFAVGVITFFLSFIPIVGAIVAGAIAVLIALVSNGWVMALIILGLVVFVQQFESSVVAPFLHSKVMAMHPVLVLIGVAAGGTLFGILGAFLAVPVLASVLAVVRYGSEHLDLRTGEVHADELKQVTPEGRKMALLAESSAPVFRMRAEQAYQQAKVEKDAARVATLERTTELAASFRDKFITPILRRGEDAKGPQDPSAPGPDDVADRGAEDPVQRPRD